MADFTGQTFGDASFVDGLGGGGNAIGEGWQTFAIETDPPVISGVTPASGSVIARFGTITFDVTDASALATVPITVYFPDTGVWEVAWYDEWGFAEQYAESTRDAITSGYRFTLRRRYGWPSAPHVRLGAVDVHGNEAT